MKRRVKADPAPPVQPTNNPPVEDIHHEVIPITGNGVAAEVPIETRIRQEIVKFNLSDQKIAELKAKYGTLKVGGLEDKEGYTTAKLAWQLVRSKRTGLEKKGKELREDYNAMNKAIRGEELRLIHLLEPLEQHLEHEWRKVDNEREEIKQSEIRAAEEQLQARVHELMGLGAQVEGEGWTIGDTVSVDVATLRQMTEERYQKFLTVAKKQAELIRIQKDKEAAARKAEEEERDRQVLEFQRQQHELQVQKAEFERQQREFQELRQKAEDLLLKQRKAEISEAMAAAGLLYDYSAETFYFKNDFISLRVRMDYMVNHFEELEQIIEKEREGIATAKQKQLEADDLKRQQAEKARQDVMSDSERLLEYVTKLRAIPKPDLTTIGCRSALYDLTEFIEKIYKDHQPATT